MKKFFSILLILASAQVSAFIPTPKTPISNPLPPTKQNVFSQTQDLTKELSKKALATLLGSFVLLSSSLSPLIPGGNALAAGGGGGSRQIGEIAASGIFFKDKLTVESFDDPKVQGVTLYISNFERPLNERLQKDFFSDPSQASVGCAKTGPIRVADNIALGKQGEEVFEENKSLLFKQLRVQRLYDKERNTVVYISFNTRLDKSSDDNKSRFKSSTCAVNLDEMQMNINTPAPVLPTPASTPIVEVAK